jgi:hypothetical protein
MPIAENLAGQRFGKLVAVCDIGRTKRGRVWKCVCDCGSETASVSTYLKNGHKRSCGCLHAESAKIAGEKQKTHGHTTKERKKFASEYHAWASMKSRCMNPNVHSFKRYGARGIKVCDRWMRFENFYEDMGPKPSERHSLERLDTDGNYEPSNCVWADAFQQASTRTNVRSICAFGKTMTAAAWQRETGIPASVIRNRIDSGWREEQAVSHPVRKIVRG